MHVFAANYLYLSASSLVGESGYAFEQRIWSHATEQKWYESPYTGISNNRFYIASGVWDVCPSGGANTKWGIARIAVIAHECAHFLGLPDLYNKDGNGGAGTFDMLGKLHFQIIFSLDVCCQY